MSRPALHFPVLNAVPKVQVCEPIHSVGHRTQHISGEPFRPLLRLGPYWVLPYDMGCVGSAHHFTACAICPITCSYSSRAPTAKASRPPIHRMAPITYDLLAGLVGPILLGKADESGVSRPVA